MINNLFIKNSVLNEYQPIINQINSLESTIKALSDSELRSKTFDLKKKI